MSFDLKNPARELTSRPIALSPDFAERVLREAKRRRSNSRRTRVLAVGAVLVAALTVVGRGPMHLRHARPARAMAGMLAASDWDAANRELSADLFAEDDAADDPGIYLVPETLDQAEGQADDADDSDLALFAQN